MTINAFSMRPRSGDIEVVLCPEAWVAISLNRMIAQQKRRLPEHLLLYPLCPKQALFTQTPFYLKEEKYILQGYCPRTPIFVRQEVPYAPCCDALLRQSLNMILYIKKQGINQVKSFYQKSIYGSAFVPEPFFRITPLNLGGAIPHTRHY